MARGRVSSVVQGDHTGGAPPRGPLAQDGDGGAGELAAAPAPAPAPARARAPEAAPPPAAPRLPEPLTPGAPSPGGGPGARTRRQRPEPGPMARADTGRGLLALTFCLLSARGKGPGGRSREWASPAPAMLARRGLRGLAPRGCVSLLCTAWHRACPPARGPCACEVCVCVCLRVGVSCRRTCPQRVPKEPGGIASARVAAARVAPSGACLCPARTRLAVASVPERAGGAGVYACTSICVGCVCNWMGLS